MKFYTNCYTHKEKALGSLKEGNLNSVSCVNSCLKCNCLCHPGGIERGGDRRPRFYPVYLEENEGISLFDFLIMFKPSKFVFIKVRLKGG